MRSMNDWIWLAVVLQVFFFSACIKEELPDTSGIVNYITVGDEVPAFSVSDGENNTFTSASLKGKRTLLVFFHTGCSDCQRELPKVNAVWKALKEEDGYQVVAIAREEKRSDVAAYWAAHHFTVPFYLDMDRSVFSLFANSTIPRLYIIDPDGVVQWMATETLDGMKAEELVWLLK